MIKRIFLIIILFVGVGKCIEKKIKIEIITPIFNKNNLIVIIKNCSQDTLYCYNFLPDYYNFASFKNNNISGIFLEAKDSLDRLIQKRPHFPNIAEPDGLLDDEPETVLKKDEVNYILNEKNIINIYDNHVKNEIIKKRLVLLSSEVKYVIIDTNWLAKYSKLKRIRIHYRVTKKLFDYIGDEYLDKNVFIGTVVSNEIFIK